MILIIIAKKINKLFVYGFVAIGQIMVQIMADSPKSGPVSSDARVNITHSGCPDKFGI